MQNPRLTFASLVLVGIALVLCSDVGPGARHLPAAYAANEPTDRPVVARVTAAEGVTVRRGGKPVPKLSEGDGLLQSDQFKVGKVGRLVMEFGGRATLAFLPGAVGRLASATGINLDMGPVIAVVKKLNLNARPRALITAPNAQAVVKGTTFLVQVSKNRTFIAVEDGQVAVSPLPMGKSAKPVLIGPNEQITVTGAKVGRPVPLDNQQRSRIREISKSEATTDAQLVARCRQAIRDCQLADGAIAAVGYRRPGDPALIEPYFANLACLGLLSGQPDKPAAEDLACVEKWLSWYEAHEVKQGAEAGTISVFDGKVAPQQGNNTARGGLSLDAKVVAPDTHDSYAATYLMVVRAYLEARRAKPTAKMLASVMRAVDLIDRCRDTNTGIYWNFDRNAVPKDRSDRVGQYLLDNIEVYQGLSAAGKLFEAMDDKPAASRARASAKALAEKLGEFWLPSEEYFVTLLADKAKQKPWTTHTLPREGLATVSALAFLGGQKPETMGKLWNKLWGADRTMLEGTFTGDDYVQEDPTVERVYLAALRSASVKDQADLAALLRTRTKELLVRNDRLTEEEARGLAYPYIHRFGMLIVALLAGSGQDLPLFPRAVIADVNDPRQRKPVPGEIRPNPVDGAKMVWIPEGTFWRGEVPTDVDRIWRKFQWPTQFKFVDNQFPLHEVSLEGYWMYQTPITNAQYRQFCGATGHAPPAFTDPTNQNKVTPTWGDARFNRDDQPVIGVSWSDAQAYCEWAQVRLPTEAEWEYAARGTHSGVPGQPRQVFVWGDELPVRGMRVGNVFDVRAKARYPATPWVFDGYVDGFAETSPVQAFPMNDFKLYDMGTNVRNWCQDWYGDKYYQQKVRLNPTGPMTGVDRVARGGSWYGDPINFRTSYRNGLAPDTANAVVGFRPAGRR